MRVASLVLLVIVLAAPACCRGEKRQPVTAMELDARVAEGCKGLESGNLQLTEAVSARQIADWSRRCGDGKGIGEALRMLGDEAAFLEPAAGRRELVTQPTLAEERAMMSRVIDYVAVTLSQLPDFLVSRHTRSYQDVSSRFSQQGILVASQMHGSGESNMLVGYRNGKEIVGGKVAGWGRDTGGSRSSGLQTWGEFGAILALVLGDAFHGAIHWGGWERNEQGVRLAVFGFSVPSRASHWTLNYCCSLNQHLSHDLEDFRATPGYHGELVVDPATGAIHRIKVEATGKEMAAVDRAAMLVEYDEVEIGGRRFRCPVHGVALSEDRYHPGMRLVGTETIQRINDVSFEAYHRFGSTAELLALDELGAADQAAARSGLARAPNASNTTPIPADISEAPAVDQDLVTTSAIAPVAAEVASVEPAANDPTPLPVLNVEARNVLLDVVVRNAKGVAVPGLEQGDFRISEAGKEQRINFFEPHGSQLAASSAGSPISDAKAPEPTTEVLLVDLLNTSPLVQMEVERQLQKLIRELKAGTPVVVYLLDERLRRIAGLTAEKEPLAEALRANENRPHKVAGSYGWQERQSDESEIDRIKAKAMNAETVATGTDGIRRSAAAKRERQMERTMVALGQIADELQMLPGRKNLIWFAEEFPVRIAPQIESSPVSTVHYEILPEGGMDRLRQMSQAMLRARVAVYPIEAAGVDREKIYDADLAGAGTVEDSLSLKRGNTQSAMAGSAASSGSDRPGTFASYNKDSAWRAERIMTQENLARETGGRAYLNGNDLAAEALQAIAEGSIYYTLAYQPAEKGHDGNYRPIRISITGDRGKALKLDYRQGYWLANGPKD